MSEQGAFGDRLGEAFRLRSPPTLVSRSLRKSLLAVTQVRCETSDHGATSPIPPEDAYLVGLQVEACPDHDLWVDGRSVPVDPLEKGTSTLYDLTRNPIASMGSPFNSLEFYLPRAALDDITDDLGVSRVRHLDFRHGAAMHDPIMHHLGACLLPALAHPEQANRLFVDHVALAFRAHIAQLYGGIQAPRRQPRGSLAPWQERRAKDLLESGLDGEVDLADVARDCGLSLSYFTRAFRQSFGVPPHRWLLLRRVARAKDLLGNSKVSLVEIALVCGFADQTHFGRVFGQIVGATPGAWRRQHVRPIPAPPCISEPLASS